MRALENLLAELTPEWMRKLRQPTDAKSCKPRCIERDPGSGGED
jgi:hypothetical protein